MKNRGDELDFYISQVFDNRAITLKGGMYVAVAEYVKEHNVDRQTIVEFLRRKGKTESSAQSITSHIWNLSLPENATVLADTKSGKITVRESRSAAATRKQIRSSLSNARSSCCARQLVVRDRKILAWALSVKWPTKSTKSF
jgi:hypothetical protein